VKRIWLLILVGLALGGATWLLLTGWKQSMGGIGGLEGFIPGKHPEPSGSVQNTATLKPPSEAQTAKTVTALQPKRSEKIERQKAIADAQTRYVAQRLAAERAAAARKRAEASERQKAEADAQAKESERQKAIADAQAKEAAQRVTAERTAVDVARRRLEAYQRERAEADAQAKKSERQAAIADSQAVQRTMAVKAAAEAARASSQADSPPKRGGAGGGRPAYHVPLATATQPIGQEADRLRAQAEQSQQQLRRQLLQQFNMILETRDTARGLIVNMSDMLFDFNKYTLRSEAKERLAMISGIILSHPGLRVEVEGYTDSMGTETYNMKLSEERADAVRGYLTRQGLASGNVTAKGFGKENPVAGNDSAVGRYQNRRVELVVSGEIIGQSNRR